MYQLVFTETYLKREKEFIEKHRDLIPVYKKVLRLLELNPEHPSLRLHKLKGKFKEVYSVSITMQYRILLKFSVVGKEIILIDIGHHEEVY
ncbi:MAG: type II toxin-antitoxin system mRNA interferase toxin, RelE/StbE family [Thermodesulfovibrio sp.]|nr:type II toxin-antitoxin system mRNA interferase toxin, RelE/StbE family [Thermodesulfovibrio sp.]MCX7723872.1 type II toxin-antitoxin system mRNA interferase toxin, RelE/StbE family [Thermodesulfovibrio sp.]MDW7973559.1 type II toxin-antitoxin system mRNA interferase toxin, RelE/StbE family [Thermodesulfovibrio sp.]